MTIRNSQRCLVLTGQKTAQADAVEKVTQHANQGARPQHFIVGADLARPGSDFGSSGMISLLTVFIFVNKRIMAGMAAGSVKG